MWGLVAAEGMKAASEASKGPNQSGGGLFDARGFMDGSGWTVSTGGSTAVGGTSGSTGAMTGAQWAQPNPADLSFANPMGSTLAGVGGVMPLLLVAGLALLLARKRRG